MFRELCLQFRDTCDDGITILIVDKYRDVHASIAIFGSGYFNVLLLDGL